MLIGLAIKHQPPLATPDAGMTKIIVVCVLGHTKNESELYLTKIALNSNTEVGKRPREIGMAIVL